MGKVIIFYKYVNILYPKQILKWQQKICTDLGLKGRVILATEGVNATLGGTQQNIDRYIDLMNNHELFGKIDFKESPGSEQNFPRLRIVIKDEIVKFGVDPLKVTAHNAGVRLSPDQTHQLLSQKPNDLVLLDTRNLYESTIGTFKDATRAPINHFRELPNYLDNNQELFKDKTVLMFCTAGVRCERATAYLKEKNVAKEVLHMDGGIQRYIEKYPDGFFRGKNYVFDARVAVKVTDDVLGNCFICKQPSDEYTNCLNSRCNKHFICCPSCMTTYKNACSSTCFELLEKNLVTRRPLFKKVMQDSCVLI